MRYPDQSPQEDGEKFATDPDCGSRQGCGVQNRLPKPYLYGH